MNAPDLNKLLLIGLGIGIIVMLSLVGWLLLSGNANPTHASLAKTFASENNAELQDNLEQVRELEAALSDLEPEMTNRPVADQQEFELAKQLAISLRRELEWIESHDSEILTQLLGTEDNARARELVEEEAGLFTLYLTVMHLNELVSERIIVDEKADVLESVEILADEIRPASIISADIAQNIAQQTGGRPAAIHAASTQYVTQFLAYKKTQWQNAPADSFEQFVEAYKLSGWYFLLETIPDAATTP